MKPSEKGPCQLMVWADSLAGYSPRLDTAFTMARKFNSDLTGIFLQQLNLLPSHDAMLQLPPQVRRSVHRDWEGLENEAASNAEKLFWDKSAEAKWRDKSQWNRIDGTPDEVAAKISHYADLIIGGQMPPTPYSDYKRVDPGAVIMKSGRPIFVVPQKFQAKGFTGHALFGWDGSRVAARAISDALMILGPESRLTIATVKSDTQIPDDFGFNLDSRFKARGIEVRQVGIDKRGRDCGRTLLDFAGKIDADLIVMGAYGHSRLRQSVFGGTTRSVLKHMRTPVFLSH